MDENIQFDDDGSNEIISRNKLFKKIILGSVPVVVIWTIFVLIVGGPDSGLVGVMLLLPVMLVVYIFYPLYFIALSIKYSRERSEMDVLDKIMFYLLAIAIVPLGVFSVYKVYSNNIIKELLIDRQQRNERKVALVDLAVRDISYTYNNLIIIKFCNDAEIQRSSFAGFFSINIESDKNSNFVLKNISASIAGKCTEEIITPSLLGLGIGDTANITVTMDSENEIDEITKENNKMTKKIVFGRRQGECFETDEGKDFYKKGMVNGRLDCCKKSLSDTTCSSQGRYIIENYCENEKTLEEVYECPNGCFDGICVE